jgi:hypothetical protein
MMSALFLKRVGALGLAALLAAGCATPPPAEKAAAVAPPPDAVAVENPGIRVESLRLTAADYMLDLRFRITDPERAAPFFSRKTTLQLIDPVSGARLVVPNTPKLGKLRQVARKDQGDRSYFMLFANPGQFVRPGARLTLAIGEIRLENLLVEGAGGNHDPRQKL